MNVTQFEMCIKTCVGEGVSLPIMHCKDPFTQVIFAPNLGGMFYV